jgi:uncharacterized membrane protein YbaN (DUF454 family)
MELDATGSGLQEFRSPPRHHGETLKDIVGLGPAVVGPWIGCCEQSGVIEIHDPRLLRRGHEAFGLALVEAAVARFGAYRAEVSLATSTCRLEFGPGRFDRSEMARRAASAVGVATPAVREGTGTGVGGRLLSATAIEDGTATTAASEQTSDDTSVADGVHESPARRRRLVHLAMAGGSFALAVGAVILPGIPTLPFLIMTGRHAVLISPGIERLLKRQPWCAALLAEAERTLGTTLDWRSLSRMLGLSVLLAAGIWVFQPPLPDILVMEVGLMAYLGWQEWRRSGRAAVRLGAVA